MSDQNRDEWFGMLRGRQAESEYSWAVAFLLSLFLGMLGADRFYLGYPYVGLLKLCTLGGLSWWWMLDVILLLAGRMKDGEGKKLKRPF